MIARFGDLPPLSGASRPKLWPREGYARVERWSQPPNVKFNWAGQAEAGRAYHGNVAALPADIDEKRS